MSSAPSRRFPRHQVVPMSVPFEHASGLLQDSHPEDPLGAKAERQQVLHDTWFPLHAAVRERRKDEARGRWRAGHNPVVKNTWGHTPLEAYLWDCRMRNELVEVAWMNEVKEVQQKWKIKQAKRGNPCT
jgi:hypothetical protein